MHAHSSEVFPFSFISHASCIGVAVTLNITAAYTSVGAAG